MRVGQVGRFLRQRDLDAGGAPGDEGCQAALADAEEGFVHLLWRGWLVGVVCWGRREEGREGERVTSEGSASPWMMFRMLM